MDIKEWNDMRLCLLCLRLAMALECLSEKLPWNVDLITCIIIKPYLCKLNGDDYTDLKRVIREIIAISLLLHSASNILSFMT